MPDSIFATLISSLLNLGSGGIIAAVLFFILRKALIKNDKLMDALLDKKNLEMLELKLAVIAEELKGLRTDLRHALPRRRSKRTTP